MTLGGRICPYCRKYTSNADARCIHCHKFLGPSWLTFGIRFFAENAAWATTVLATISIVVFFGEILVTVATVHPPPTLGDFIFKGAPSDVMARFGALPFGDWMAPWLYVTACYVHYNALHVLFNMVALFDFGRVVEPQIKGARVIVAYTVTGVIGFAVSTVWYWGHYGGGTAGASGAVFGIQGVLLGQMLAARDPRFQQFLIRTIAYSVVFYYALGTNNAAHLGGLFSGIALGYAFGKEARPWTREKYFLPAAAVCMLVTVASLLMAQYSYVHL